MAGKSLALRVAFLEILLNATALANVWDNAASSPLTTLYLSLLTADPGTTNDQTVNEVAYTSYARVAVARTVGGWTVNATTGIATPVASILFPAPTAVYATPATYVGVGSSGSGTGYLFWSGAVSPTIFFTVGKQPTLTTSSQIVET